MITVVLRLLTGKYSAISLDNVVHINLGRILTIGPDQRPLLP